MKRVIPALLVILALILPVFASAPGQSQTMLRATEDSGFTCSDVSLGNFVTDTMRLAAGTDFALLPSELLGLNLPSGPVDEETLALSLPRDECVYLVSLTLAQLKEILELSSSTLTLNAEESLDAEASHWGGFLQLSGIKVIYDVPAPVGDRLYEANLEDGAELNMTDRTTVYTAAVPASMLDGTYGYPALTPEGEVGTLRDLTFRRIAAEGITKEPAGRRIILYGARQNEIIDSFSPVILIFVILIFVFFGGHKWRRALNFER